MERMWKVEYMILATMSIQELEGKVDAFMKDGWIPQGGIAVYVDYDEGKPQNFIAQAMILKPKHSE